MSGLFAAFQCLVYLVCLVYSVCLVCLVERNYMNQTDQTNQMDQTDRRALYDHDDYLPSGSPSNSPKLGTPSSEGIGIDLYSVYLIP